MLKEFFAVGSYQRLQSDVTFQDKLVRVFKTYGLVLLALIAVGPFLVLVDKFVVSVLHHKSLNDINTQQFKQLYKKLGTTVSVIFICLIGPMFEEAIFRLGLKFKRREVIIALFVAFFYFGATFARKAVPANQGWIIVEICAALLVMTIGICCYAIPNTPLNLSDQIKLRLTVLSMILFGLMHAFNYKPLEWGLLWLYPIYVIPQLLMGWGLTYVRLKNGFAWGIALHCLINTVSTVLTLVLKK